VGLTLLKHRSKTRFAVCRCLCGASRSARSIGRSPTCKGSDASTAAAASCAAEAKPAPKRCTVGWPTPYLRITALFDIPARQSLRIAAYNSTLDLGAPSQHGAAHAPTASPPVLPKLSDIRAPQFEVSTALSDTWSRNSPTDPCVGLSREVPRQGAWQGLGRLRKTAPVSPAGRRGALVAPVISKAAPSLPRLLLTFPFSCRG
jgi:hypothetical protein